MLAGVHPAERFQGDRAYTLPYGKQEDKDGNFVGYALGSLDLLGDVSGIIPLFQTFTPMTAATGSGDEERAQALNLPPGSCDLVIMNPPFTRPTNHEGKRANVPNPAFAAFGADPLEQEALGNVAKKVGRNICANGNAGIASHFIALADRMVKPGGTVALVLPLAVLQGESWQKARSLWLEGYRDITVITIAGARPLDKSFSADTGMGETLVIARKCQSKSDSKRGWFVTLIQCPQTVMEGMEIARLLNLAKVSSNVRRLEDGPFGGTAVYVGQVQVGEVLDCPLPAGKQWPVAGISDLSLAQSAHQISLGKLWLPGQFDNDTLRMIPITTFRQIANRGFLDRDINGSGGRGAFDILDARRSSAAYPSLWTRDSDRQRSMVVEPDSEGVVRIGREQRAADIWATRSRAHHNRDFQFNANSLAVAFTETPTIGGRAWPNVVFDDPMHEIAFTLWGNSTLGMLCYWWHATKQQSGRGSITISALESLPILDSTQLADGQLVAAVKIFEDMKYQAMLPFNEADHDPVRQELDRRFIGEVFGLEQSIVMAVDLLRRKLCAEPSIHGGKVSRVKLY